MRKANERPDSQSHHHLHFLDRNIDINFRYYSPSKSVSSQQQIASEEKLLSIPLSESSDMMNDMSSIFPKKMHDPKQASDKFYDNQMNDARNSIMNYYEKFQARLLEPHLKSKNMHSTRRVTKLNLSQTRKSQNKSLKRSPPFRQIRNNNNKNDRKSYVKRAHINLICKNHKDAKETGESKSLSKQKQNKPERVVEQARARLKIKLYDERKDQNRVSLPFRTPRTSSRNKKGIRVFSSASTKKNEDSYMTDQQTKKATLSAHETKRLGESSKKIDLNRSKMSVSRFNDQLGNSLKKSKKRIFSRQKLGRSSKPKIFLYKENK